jgi:hypothetical protein
VQATASASRTVIRRFSDASAMVAPPVHGFDGAFQTMVVSEASTSLATFSRTVPLLSKQPRTSACRRRRSGCAQVRRYG